MSDQLIEKLKSLSTRLAKARMISMSKEVRQIAAALSCAPTGVMEHKRGCDALGGYGHGVGKCTCGAANPAASAQPVGEVSEGGRLVAFTELAPGTPLYASPPTVPADVGMSEIKAAWLVTAMRAFPEKSKSECREEIERVIAAVRAKGVRG